VLINFLHRADMIMYAPIYPIYPLHLPYISPIPPYISPISPLYLPYISRCADMIMYGDLTTNMP
jgi:hypothetical protein